MQAYPETLNEAIERQVQAALTEDIGPGDITAALLPEQTQARARILCREDAVLCGTAWVDAVYRQLGGVSLQWHLRDGDRVPPDTTLCSLSGPTRTLLTGERTALNFLQTLMGTATRARQYADAVGDGPVRVIDTRKTLPGLRAAQKYAVRCGGCANHRQGLYDAFLIKENHIAACGSITRAVDNARRIDPDKAIIVEVENLDEFREALATGPHRIMLDNFSAQQIHQAQALQPATDAVPIEISGNMDLNAARALNPQGPVYVSAGDLTKTLAPIDLSLRLEG